MNHVCRRRPMVGLAPAYRVAFQIVLLPPHASQNCHSRMRPPFFRLGFGIDPPQQLPPVLSDLEGEAVPFTFRLWEVLLLTARSIPFIPVRGSASLPPLRSDCSEPIQGIAHRFAHTRQPVQLARCRL